MLGGFNTNIRYGERLYHVQTEDGGADSPSVITLLYQGGAILFSKKRSYEDQLGQPDLESQVRQLMEEQHRLMVSALKAGKLDDKIGLETAEVGSDDSTSKVAFGAAWVSDRSLDEVVIEFVASL